MTAVITAPDPSMTDVKYAPYLVVKNLKTQIDDTLKVLEGTEPKDTALMNDFVALSADVVAVANAWQTTEFSQLQGKAKELNDRYYALRPRVPVIRGFAASTGANVLDLLVMIAVLFGGIIASHYFITMSVQYRLYYFIFGAALFPFSLMAAVVSPPQWRATIFPWVEGTKGFLSFVAPSPMDKPGQALRWISASLLLTIVVFYTGLYGRLPV